MRPVSVADSWRFVTQMTFDRHLLPPYTVAWRELCMAYQVKAQGIPPVPSKWRGIWWRRGTR